MAGVMKMAIEIMKEIFNNNRRRKWRREINGVNQRKPAGIAAKAGGVAGEQCQRKSNSGSALAAKWANLNGASMKIMKSSVCSLAKQAISHRCGGSGREGGGGVELRQRRRSRGESVG